MRFVILHGTEATHESNWFPWLQSKLEQDGHEVWVPDLPITNEPNAELWSNYLLKSNYDFKGSVVIGHSAGAVEICALLQGLDPTIRLHAAILVGVFRGDLGWEALRGMNISFDYPKIATRADKFYVIHSDNDPHCPLEGAQWIAKRLGAEFIMLPKMGHFSAGLDERFKEFPELHSIIKDKVLS